MKEYLEISNKTLASKQASKQASIMAMTHPPGAKNDRTEECVPAWQ